MNVKTFLLSYKDDPFTYPLAFVPASSLEEAVDSLGGLVAWRRDDEDMSKLVMPKDRFAELPLPGEVTHHVLYRDREAWKKQGLPVSEAITLDLQALPTIPIQGALGLEN